MDDVANAPFYFSLNKIGRTACCGLLISRVGFNGFASMAFSASGVVDGGGDLLIARGQRVLVACAGVTLVSVDWTAFRGGPSHIVDAGGARVL